MSKIAPCLWHDAARAKAAFDAMSAMIRIDIAAIEAAADAA